MSGPPRLPGSQHFNKVLGGSQCLLCKDVPWETMQFIPGCPFCFQMHSTHRWSRVSVEPHSAPLMILPIHKKPSSMTCVMSWQKWICPDSGWPVVWLTLCQVDMRMQNPCPDFPCAAPNIQKTSLFLPVKRLHTTDHRKPRFTVCHTTTLKAQICLRFSPNTSCWIRISISAQTA